VKDSPSERDDASKTAYKPIERLRKKLQTDILFIWILVLLKEDQKYGYELRSEIKERFGFAPATVTSYHVLYKLEREGFIQPIEQNINPNRKYYEITEKGLLLIDETREFFERTMNYLFE